MKQFITIFLVSLFILFQLGTVLLSYTKPLIHYISSSRQAILLNSADKEFRLVHITLSSKQYIAELQDEQEIKHEGKLFDIISINRSVDSVSLLLEPDQLETSLLTKYDRIMDWYMKTHPADSQNEIKLWKWVLQLYTPLNSDYACNFKENKSISFSALHLNKLPSKFQAAPFLPPRSC